jgi:hypothetical protein
LRIKKHVVSPVIYQNSGIWRIIVGEQIKNPCGRSRRDGRIISKWNIDKLDVKVRAGFNCIKIRDYV